MDGDLMNWAAQLFPPPPVSSVAIYEDIAAGAGRRDASGGRAAAHDDYYDTSNPLHPHPTCNYADYEAVTQAAALEALKHRNQELEAEVDMLRTSNADLESKLILAHQEIADRNAHIRRLDHAQSIRNMFDDKPAVSQGSIPVSIPIPISFGGVRNSDHSGRFEIIQDDVPNVDSFLSELHQQQQQQDDMAADGQQDVEYLGGFDCVDGFQMLGGLPGNTYCSFGGSLPGSSVVVTFHGPDDDANVSGFDVEDPSASFEPDTIGSSLNACSAQQEQQQEQQQQEQHEDAPVCDVGVDDTQCFDPAQQARQILLDAQHDLLASKDWTMGKLRECARTAGFISSAKRKADFVAGLMEFLTTRH